MKRLAPLAFFLLLAGAAFAYHLNNNASWNQKLTLTLSTPTGEISVSNVVQVKMKRRLNIAGTGGQYLFVQGEALSVDLGDGQFLFVLLTGQDTLLYRTMRRLQLLESGNQFSKRKQLQRQMEPLEVALDDMPLMVTFGDVNKPASVREVNPADTVVALGARYTVRSMVVQATGEAVTEGRIAEMIPCINAGKGCYWHNLGLPYSDPLSHLNGAFKRKLK